MRVLIYICFLLTIVSCKKQPVPDFLLPMEVNFDVPVGLNTVETHYFRVPNIPTFLDLSLEGLGLSYEDVASITSRTGLITSSTGGTNLDFINRIIINIYDEDKVTELFYLENIQFGSKEEIQLLASIPELRERMSQDFVNIEVGLGFRSFPPANFNCRAVLDFSVFLED